MYSTESTFILPLWISSESGSQKPLNSLYTDPTLAKHAFMQLRINAKGTIICVTACLFITWLDRGMHSQSLVKTQPLLNCLALTHSYAATVKSGVDRAKCLCGENIIPAKEESDPTNRNVRA